CPLEYRLQPALSCWLSAGNLNEEGRLKPVLQRLALPPENSPMHLPREMRTERLLLRRWTDADRPAFAKLNSDPRVMEFLPKLISQEESDAMAERIALQFEQHGFGLWAVEIPGVTPFAGYVGLVVPAFEAHFTPCVEVGWRLAAEHWNRG